MQYLSLYCNISQNIIRFAGKYYRDSNCFHTFQPNKFRGKYTSYNNDKLQQCANTEYIFHDEILSKRGILTIY